MIDVQMAIYYCLFPIGEDDLLDVLEEMMPVVNSWKAIGRGLRIDFGHLEMIQKDNCGNSKECLSEMLTCWLKRNYNVERFGEPTWQAVVKVVARPAAGDNCALALNIAEKHASRVSPGPCSATQSEEIEKTFEADIAKQHSGNTS